ncbi:MAG TPA: hypothetical protein VFQ70_01045 [Candidatus Saccharimonadaceae bacterium]|nr:hypothetical protein [Candidatus Saccharimonadaceae bacterium]
MTQHIDLTHVTTEVAMRTGKTVAVANLLMDFCRLVYGSTLTPDAESIEDVATEAWTIEWRSRPSARVQIRTKAAALLPLVYRVLVALGYEVRNKGDHLVVLLQD